MGHEVGDSVIFGLVALHLLFVGQNLCCNRWAETFLHFPKGKHDMPSFFFLGRRFLQRHEQGTVQPVLPGLQEVFEQRRDNVFVSVVVGIERNK